MSNDKVFIFGFFSFIAFIHGQMYVRGQFIRDEFLGNWYVVRMMVPKSSCYFIMECLSLTINLRFNPIKFRQTFWYTENGVSDLIVTYGAIENSEIFYTNPSNKTETMMTVTKYNNGDELILVGKSNKSLSKLLSRNRTASTGTIKSFRNKADDANMLSIAIVQDDCA